MWYSLIHEKHEHEKLDLCQKAFVWHFVLTCVGGQQAAEMCLRNLQEWQSRNLQWNLKSHTYKTEEKSRLSEVPNDVTHPAVEFAVNLQSL